MEGFHDTYICGYQLISSNMLTYLKAMILYKTKHKNSTSFMKPTTLQQDLNKFTQWNNLQQIKHRWIDSYHQEIFGLILWCHFTADLWVS